MKRAIPNLERMYNYKVVPRRTRYSCYREMRGVDGRTSVHLFPSIPKVKVITLIICRFGCHESYICHDYGRLTQPCIATAVVLAGPSLIESRLRVLSGCHASGKGECSPSSACGIAGLRGYLTSLRQELKAPSLLDLFNSLHCLVRSRGALLPRACRALG